MGCGAEFFIGGLELFGREGRDGGGAGEAIDFGFDGGFFRFQLLQAVPHSGDIVSVFDGRDDIVYLRLDGALLLLHGL